jgi:shikimate dehydrogenase
LSVNERADAKGGSGVAGAPPVLRAGLLGRGIGASRSPRMHIAEGERLGLRYEYRLFDFDRLELEDAGLPRLVRELQREGYAGLNVTHPFKERVISLLDGLSPDAAAIGAVNTVVFSHGEATGHNTDSWGFTQSFRRGLKGSRLDDVVLVGAGGAGMAVAKALLDLGVRKLGIFDADRTRTERLVGRLCARHDNGRIVEVKNLRAALLGADGLVNATPMGMAKYPGMPVEAESLRPGLWVADIVYFPAETDLMKAARESGCQTLSGEAMAIFQAVKAFELITGMTPDPEAMARHFSAGDSDALT